MTDDKPDWPKCCDRDMSWLPDDKKYHCAKCGSELRFVVVIPGLPNLPPQWQIFWRNYCADFRGLRDRNIFFSLLQLYDRLENSVGAGRCGMDALRPVIEVMEELRSYKEMP